MTVRNAEPDYAAIRERHGRALCESAAQRKAEYLDSKAFAALWLGVYFPDDPWPWELETWEGEGGR